MSIRSLIAGVLLGTSTSAGAPPEVEAAYEKGEIEVPVAEGTRTIPYRLHRPEDASSDEPRPLVIFLHGAGERGDDNQSQLRHFPDRWIRESHLGRRGVLPKRHRNLQAPKSAARTDAQARDERSV